MNQKLWLVLVPAVAILCRPALIWAQKPSAMRGRIVGTVSDPTGAFVRGAEVKVTNLATGTEFSMKTGATGEFRVPGLPAGAYRISVRAAEFRPAVVPDIKVSTGKLSLAEVILRIAPVSAQVEVEGGESDSAVARQEGEESPDAADLLRTVPGVSLRGNGEFASIPMVHGMGDERTKIVVNGMMVSPSCPNRMNPPLTYVSTANADRITVIAGITPVSEGGDSLGGTIMIDSPAPVFAAPGGRIREETSFSPFYRSNGTGYGGSFSEWIAGRSVAVGYNGSFATMSDYADGAGGRITSTYGRRIDNTVTLAARRGPNLYVLRAGVHSIPWQGFVNARMDMLNNLATRLNFHYRRTFRRGLLDAHVYYQNTAHTMNMGRDKAKFPMPMYMPMNSHGTDSGYSVEDEIPLSARHTLRVGSEVHRFVLNDSWAPVAGQAPMMGPNTFVDINNGRRTRLGSYVEVASLWNREWTTLFGVRNDTIWSNAGPVHGYSMMYAANAAAFNAVSHARTDADFDATALVRYRASDSVTVEIGYARKSRAPSLYERYAWSTSPMISSMIGWFGDGNDYVGNPDLQPEVAHTVSGTLSVHSGSAQFAATPYVTLIHDYVDVNQIQTLAVGVNTVAQLRFSNHPARIAGADFSGSTRIWNNAGFGRGTLTVVAGWLQGTRTDSGTGLYDMMPVHARFEIDQEFERWQNGVAVQFVDRKSSVDPLRFERQTPGYTLFSVHTAYHRGPLRLSGAATNLLNRQYQLPLGGVNMDACLASMATGRIEPVAGAGRSIDVGLTVRF